MMRAWPLVCAAGLALGSAIPPPAVAPGPIALDYELASLDPVADGSGDALLTFIPAPPAPPHPAIADDGLRLLVSLPQQKLYVFDEGALVATSRVSTGKRGHGTPVGIFHILQKAVTHHSNLYDDASMPYMQRLTTGGVALHAGHVPGFPASHGCIRLPYAFARRLYRMTHIATKVVVTRARPRSAEEAARLV